MPVDSLHTRQFAHDLQSLVSKELQAVQDLHVDHLRGRNGDVLALKRLGEDMTVHLTARLTEVSEILQAAASEEANPADYQVQLNQKIRPIIADVDRELEEFHTSLNATIAKMDPRKLGLKRLQKRLKRLEHREAQLKRKVEQELLQLTQLEDTGALDGADASAFSPTRSGRGWDGTDPSAMGMLSLVYLSKQMTQELRHCERHQTLAEQLDAAPHTHESDGARHAAVLDTLPNETRRLLGGEISSGKKRDIVWALAHVQGLAAVSSFEHRIMLRVLSHCPNQILDPKDRETKVQIRRACSELVERRRLKDQERVRTKLAALKKPSAIKAFIKSRASGEAEESLPLTIDLACEALVAAGKQKKEKAFTASDGTEFTAGQMAVLKQLQLTDDGLSEALDMVHSQREQQVNVEKLIPGVALLSWEQANATLDGRRELDEGVIQKQLSRKDDATVREWVQQRAKGMPKAPSRAIGQACKLFHALQTGQTALLDRDEVALLNALDDSLQEADSERERLVLILEALYEQVEGYDWQDGAEASAGPWQPIVDDLFEFRKEQIAIQQISRHLTASVDESMGEVEMNASWVQQALVAREAHQRDRLEAEMATLENRYGIEDRDQFVEQAQAQYNALQTTMRELTSELQAVRGETPDAAQTARLDRSAQDLLDLALQSKRRVDRMVASEGYTMADARKVVTGQMSSEIQGRVEEMLLADSLGIIDLTATLPGTPEGGADSDYMEANPSFAVARTLVGVSRLVQDIDDIVVDEEISIDRLVTFSNTFAQLFDNPDLSVETREFAHMIGNQLAGAVNRKIETDIKKRMTEELDSFRRRGRGVSKEGSLELSYGSGIAKVTVKVSYSYSAATADDTSITISQAGGISLSGSLEGDAGKASVEGSTKLTKGTKFNGIDDFAKYVALNATAGVMVRGATKTRDARRTKRQLEKVLTDERQAIAQGQHLGTVLHRTAPELFHQTDHLVVGRSAMHVQPVSVYAAKIAGKVSGEIGVDDHKLGLEVTVDTMHKSAYRRVPLGDFLSRQAHLLRLVRTPIPTVVNEADVSHMNGERQIASGLQTLQHDWLTLVRRCNTLTELEARLESGDYMNSQALGQEIERLEQAIEDAEEQIQAKSRQLKEEDVGRGQRALQSEINTLHKSIRRNSKKLRGCQQQWDQLQTLHRQRITIARAEIRDILKTRGITYSGSEPPKPELIDRYITRQLEVEKALINRYHDIISTRVKGLEQDLASAKRRLLHPGGSTHQVRLARRRRAEKKLGEIRQELKQKKDLLGYLDGRMEVIKETDQPISKRQSVRKAVSSVVRSGSATPGSSRTMLEVDTSLTTPGAGPSKAVLADAVVTEMERFSMPHRDQIGPDAPIRRDLMQARRELHEQLGRLDPARDSKEIAEIQSVIQEVDNCRELQQTWARNQITTNYAEFRVYRQTVNELDRLKARQAEIKQQMWKIQDSLGRDFDLTQAAKSKLSAQHAALEMELSGQPGRLGGKGLKGKIEQLTRQKHNLEVARTGHSRGRASMLRELIVAHYNYKQLFQDMSSEAEYERFSNEDGIASIEAQYRDLDIALTDDQIHELFAVESYEGQTNTQSMKFTLTTPQDIPISVTITRQNVKEDPNPDNEGHYININLEMGVGDSAMANSITQAILKQIETGKLRMDSGQKFSRQALKDHAKEIGKSIVSSAVNIGAEKGSKAVKEKLLRDYIAGIGDPETRAAMEDNFDEIIDEGTDDLISEAEEVGNSDLVEALEDVPTFEIGLSSRKQTVSLQLNMVRSDQLGTNTYNTQYCRIVRGEKSELSVEGISLGGGFSTGGSVSTSETVPLIEILGTNTITYVIGLHHGWTRAGTVDREWPELVRRNDFMMRELMTNMAEEGNNAYAEMRAAVEDAALDNPYVEATWKRFQARVEEMNAPIRPHSKSKDRERIEHAFLEAASEFSDLIRLTYEPRKWVGEQL